jgi:polyhydroxyalkanoate synthesis regulator protein
MQARAMQGMLGNYLEQSAKAIMDMQQRCRDQTRGLFTAFPFPISAHATIGRRREKALMPRSAATSALQRGIFAHRTIAR